jgi:hypothetical protein
VSTNKRCARAIYRPSLATWLHLRCHVKAFEACASCAVRCLKLCALVGQGAKGAEVVVSGKLRAQRAKSMKFIDGYMIKSGQAKQGERVIIALSESHQI